MPAGSPTMGRRRPPRWRRPTARSRRSTSPSRPARRFAHPVIVFNPHDQFERLREQNRYGRMREAIMARDAKLAGSTNPMLAQKLGVWIFALIGIASWLSRSGAATTLSS